MTRQIITESIEANVSDISRRYNENLEESKEKGSKEAC